MTLINGKRYRELRCKNDSCRKFIIFEAILIGRVAIQCPRCGEMNEYRFTMLKTQDNINTIEHTLMKGGEQ